MDPSSNKRRNPDQQDIDTSSSPIKKQKTDEEVVLESKRPKSKKELRREKKVAAAFKATSDEATAAPADAGGTEDASPTHNKKLTREEKMQLRKEQRKQDRKSQKEASERAKAARFEEQNQLRREKDQQSKIEAEVASKQKTNKQKRKQKQQEREQKRMLLKLKGGDVDDYSVYKSIYKKSTDAATGYTTCRLGVQYKDDTVGTGPIVQSKSLVTVKYQLRGKTRHGLLIDKSKKFTFRLGKGEVIQGWEIGLDGMQQGGIRHLMVPPKAGYFSQDIGAGPGGMLHFDITLLETRG